MAMSRGCSCSDLTTTRNQSLPFEKVRDALGQLAWREPVPLKFSYSSNKKLM